MSEKKTFSRGRYADERAASPRPAVVAGLVQTPGPTPADERAAAEHRAWLARYLPVEQAIMADCERRRERRLELRAKRRADNARAFGDVCECSEGQSAYWRRGEFGPGEEFVLSLMRDSGYILYLDWARRFSSGRVDALRGAMRRPLYYARENERRRALAAERRWIRRRTTENPCPTKEQILDAWLHVKDSHEATIRFGGLVEDLECYLDNSLIRNEDGAIVGRCPGVKGWLKDNVPALWLKYTTVMRYKAAAKKLRQLAGISDPTPVDAVLAPAAKETPDVAVVRARAVWLEVAASAGKSPTSLVARIDALVDPEQVDDANMLREWRERYENEITVRTRKRWWRRLMKMDASAAWKRTLGESVSGGMRFGMNMKTIMATIAAGLLVGCVSGPKVDNTPVAALDTNRYLGEWYEIARFDHSFERGIEQAKAVYTLNDDGTLKVVNSGMKNGKPKKAIGKGKLTDTPALLRVSFFGPFYADYRVMMIDANYTYALVGSGGTDYLWILSRTPTLADDAKSALLVEARRRGYETGKLIWVKHD